MLASSLSSGCFSPEISNNANLDSLEVGCLYSNEDDCEQPAELIPAFDAEQQNYRVELEYGASIFWLRARAAQQEATMRIEHHTKQEQIDSKILPSGEKYHSITKKSQALPIGDNNFLLIVTAANGATRHYRLVVTRASPVVGGILPAPLSAIDTPQHQSLADPVAREILQTPSLSQLQLSAGQLQPQFHPNTRHYRIHQLPTNGAILWLAPTSADDHLYINGAEVAREYPIAAAQFTPLLIEISNPAGLLGRYRLDISR